MPHQFRPRRGVRKGQKVTVKRRRGIGPGQNQMPFFGRPFERLRLLAIRKKLAVATRPQLYMALKLTAEQALAVELDYQVHAAKFRGDVFRHVQAEKKAIHDLEQSGYTFEKK